MAINLDRDVIIDVNLDNGKIVKPNNASYYNTDSNIAFFYVKLRKTVDGIIEYIKKEDAYKYTVKMKIVKPKSLNVKSINSIMSDDIIDGDCALYKFTIDNSLMNEVGNPFCYISIVYNEQELVTEGFTYTIKQDPLSGYNAVLLNDPDMPILLKLIETVRSEHENIDDLNIRDDKTFSSSKMTLLLNQKADINQIWGMDNLSDDVKKAINKTVTASDITIENANNNYIGDNVEIVLDEIYTKIENNTHTHTNKSVLDNITADKILEWNNRSNFSGSYNDLTDKPTIPVKTSQLTNDSNYATVSDLNGKVDKVTGKSLVLDTEISKIHEHSNKSVLDSITQAKINAWDAGTGNSGGSGGTASSVTIADANNNYSSDNVEGALDEIANSIKNFVSTQEIVSYDTFPSDAVLNALPFGAVFEVKGFYAPGDMPKCAYTKEYYAENSFKKNDGNTDYYIKPVIDNGTIFLPQFGIRTGEANAASNSSILANIFYAHGATLKLPAGEFFFESTIELRAKQLSLIGECVSFSPDTNSKGFTVLTFKNLPEGGKGINMGTGTLANITVRGNSDHYDYYIDRTKTYIDKNAIEQETCVRKCYGIYGDASITTMFNIRVEYFYWGIWFHTANDYITNVFARRCHIGIYIGGDTKCKGIYGWDVHTLLQMNRSISSAAQVRADSCHHLVHIYGNPAGICLSDLDGDYCLGSVLRIGDEGESWGNVEGLTVTGITGRHCCYNVYDETTDTVPTSANITDDVRHWGFISIEPNTLLNGAVITIAMPDIISNPLDYTSNYKTPPILIASAGECHAVFTTSFRSNSHYQAPNRETLVNTIAIRNAGERAAKVALNTPAGSFYYKKSYDSITTTKASTETLS